MRLHLVLVLAHPLAGYTGLRTFGFARLHPHYGLPHTDYAHGWLGCRSHTRGSPRSAFIHTRLVVAFVGCLRYLYVPVWTVWLPHVCLRTVAFTFIHTVTRTLRLFTRTVRGLRFYVCVYVPVGCRLQFPRLPTRLHYAHGWFDYGWLRCVAFCYGYWRLRLLRLHGYTVGVYLPVYGCLRTVCYRARLRCARAFTVGLPHAFAVTHALRYTRLHVAVTFTRYAFDSLRGCTFTFTFVTALFLHHVYGLRLHTLGLRTVTVTHGRGLHSWLVHVTATRLWLVTHRTLYSYFRLRCTLRVATVHTHVAHALHLVGSVTVTHIAAFTTHTHLVTLRFTVQFTRYGLPHVYRALRLPVYVAVVHDLHSLVTCARTRALRLRAALLRLPRLAVWVGLRCAVCVWLRLRLVGYRA